MSGIGSCLSTRNSWRAIAALLITNEAAYRKRLTKLEGFPPLCLDKSVMTDLIEELERVPAILRTLVKVRGLPEPAYDGEQWDRVRGVALVLVLAAAQLEQVFRERGTVDFPAVSMAAVVAVDGYHNNETKDVEHYRWEGTKNGGYSQLGAVIQGLGGELRTVREAIAAKTLRGVDVLIIADPDTPAEASEPKYIGPAEIDALEKWVGDGGRLVLLGNDKGNAEFEHFNQLAARFGIDFVETLYRDADGKSKLNLTSRSPVLGAGLTAYLVDVAPLKITSRAPRRTAISGNAAAGYTPSDVPSARNSVARDASSWARSRSSATRFSPKLIVADLRMPPQLRQGGSSSPAWTRASARSIGARSPQSRHTTSRMVPWISTNRSSEVPAAACSPSTFWVINRCRLPACSSRTSARWPSLGWAFQAGDSSRFRQARRRVSGSAT
jgi:hypothetical protein